MKRMQDGHDDEPGSGSVVLTSSVCFVTSITPWPVSVGFGSGEDNPLHHCVHPLIILLKCAEHAQDTIQSHGKRVIRVILFFAEEKE